MAASTDQRWPLWVTIIAIVILIPPLVWALSAVMHIAAAAGIGLLLAIVALVALFVWLKRRVDEQR